MSVDISNSARAADRLFLADLHKRGITKAQADAAGLLYSPNARRWFREFPAVAAIGIRYFDLDSNPMTFRRGVEEAHFGRIRLLEEPAKGFVRTKPRRYQQPYSSGTRAYFPKVSSINWRDVASDPKYRLIVTEGELKALVACLSGFLTIGLGGVWNFTIKGGGLLPELQAVTWRGRQVYIVFDSDLIAKPDVQIAERRLVAELVAYGAIVHPVRLPQGQGSEKVGIDDFLLMHGTVALTQLLESTPVAEPGKSLVLEGTDVEIADSVLRDLSDRFGSNVVFCEGAFHVYQETRWRFLRDEEIRNAIFTYDKLRFKPRTGGIVKLSKGRVDSILSIMRDRATDLDFFTDAPAGINCASGFIRFDADSTAHLDPHDRDHRQRHCLPGTWSPNASGQGAELLSKFLWGCFGEDADFDDRVALVSEILGVAALGMATKLRSPKAIVLFGRTAENGKSELLSMARGLLPDDAICAVSPTRFGDERMLIKLSGRTLNACDELGSTHAIASDTFKSVVTGNPVTAKELYRPAVSFSPSALHLYATNILPPFHGGFDRGVQRRLLVLSFNRSIPKDVQIAEIGRRVAAEEADRLLAFAVEGAARVLRLGRFTEPLSSRHTLREWISNADPVLAWLAERVEFVEGYKLPTKQAHADFMSWAQTEGLRDNRLPAAPTFVNRILAQDGRITNARSNSERYIVGIRLRPAGIIGRRQE